MNRQTKKGLLALAVLGIILPLFSCGGNREAAKKPELKIINVGVTNDPATLNPIATNNVLASTLTGTIYLPLTAIDENLKFVYRLAENVATRDNKIFTIKINKNIKWTDGKNVSADDVVWSLNLYTNPKTGTHEPSTYNIILGTDNSGLIENGGDTLAGVKKIDDHTLTIEVKYPITLDIFNLTLGGLRTLPRHIYGSEPVENLRKSPLLQNPQVTNGPLKFKEYAAASHITFETNKDFALGKPIIDLINFKFLPGTQITAQLESGEIDMNYPLVGNIPNDDYDRIKRQPHLRTALGVPSNIQVLFINSKTINNLKVRQALDLAIDRQGILDNVLKGAAEISRTPVTNRIQYWNEAASKWVYDPDRARQLINESGWDKSKKIVFALPAGNSTREKVGTILVEAFNNIGLNVVIEKGDFAATLAKVQSANNYDLSIIGMPDVPFNIVRYLRVYAATQYTWTNYSNPAADRLVDTIQTSIDDTVVKNAYYALQELIAEEVPVAGIYSELALRAVNKRIKYGEIKEYGQLLDIDKWDVE
ncbi:MAG: ABC transporter substrate-binding protein [Spirochaetaceae bacterium]|jgi:peptide/nickel transport system substrate-binding protein|nr:ABC transporter substrate-binding protein [Spirochaetaceae bacterium]